MGNFARQLQAFADKTERKLDLAVQKIALELFSRVILRSPVDQGRFRANWQVSISTASQGTLDLDDKSGTATIDRATAATLQLKAGDVIFLVNNLPYGLKLEDGSSSQAPAGMVGLSVQEFQEIARDVGFELVQL